VSERILPAPASTPAAPTRTLDDPRAAFPVSGPVPLSVRPPAAVTAELHEQIVHSRLVHQEDLVPCLA
jgi:hypothetical protein